MAMYGFEMKAAVADNRLTGPMKGGLYENLVNGNVGRDGKKATLPLYMAMFLFER